MKINLIITVSIDYLKHSQNDFRLDFIADLGIKYLFLRTHNHV